MPQRTTIAAVKGLLGRDYDSNKLYDVQPYIDGAWPMVDRVVTCATNKGITLTDAELEIIERHVAAHRYQMMDQAFSTKSTSSASASFQGVTDKGLEGTKYGQSALDLDYSGCLMNITKKQRATGAWLGTCPPPFLGTQRPSGF